MLPPSTLYKFIGKKIQAFRKKAGFTQSKLADVVSLDRSSITNIEKGRQKMLIHTAYDLAAALGIAPADLFPTSKDLTKLIKPEKSELNKLKNKDEEMWFKTIKLKRQEKTDDQKN